LSCFGGMKDKKKLCRIACKVLARSTQRERERGGERERESQIEEGGIEIHDLCYRSPSVFDAEIFAILTTHAPEKQREPKGKKEIENQNFGVLGWSLIMNSTFVASLLFEDSLAVLLRYYRYFGCITSNIEENLYLQNGQK
jgi:hypothetical protein